MLMSVGLRGGMHASPPGGDEGLRTRTLRKPRKGWRETNDEGRFHHAHPGRGLVGGRMASWATRGVATPTSTCPPATVLSRDGGAECRRYRGATSRASRPDNREDGAACPVRLQELRQRGGCGGGERRGRRRGLQVGRRRQDHAQCRASHRRSRCGRRWPAYVRQVSFSIHPVMFTCRLNRSEIS